MMIFPPGNEVPSGSWIIFQETDEFDNRFIIQRFQISTENKPQMLTLEHIFFSLIHIWNSINWNLIKKEMIQKINLIKIIKWNLFFNTYVDVSLPFLQHLILFSVFRFTEQQQQQQKNSLKWNCVDCVYCSYSSSFGKSVIIRIL